MSVTAALFAAPILMGVCGLVVAGLSVCFIRSGRF
jgi:hypothetical protein